MRGLGKWEARVVLAGIGGNAGEVGLGGDAGCSRRRRGRGQGVGRAGGGTGGPRGGRRDAEGEKNKGENGELRVLWDPRGSVF